MKQFWGRRRLLSLLVVYAAAACVGPVVYASSQVLLEHAHPTKAVAPPSPKNSRVAWVPIVRGPGGLICALGKDEQSTCMGPAADRTKIDNFISEMARAYDDYCACTPQGGDVVPKNPK